MLRKFQRYLLDGWQMKWTMGSRPPRFTVNSCSSWMVCSWRIFPVSHTFKIPQEQFSKCEGAGIPWVLHPAPSVTSLLCQFLNPPCPSPSLLLNLRTNFFFFFFFEYLVLENPNVSHKVTPLLDQFPTHRTLLSETLPSLAWKNPGLAESRSRKSTFADSPWHAGALFPDVEKIQHLKSLIC